MLRYSLDFLKNRHKKSVRVHAVGGGLVSEKCYFWLCNYNLLYISVL